MPWSLPISSIADLFLTVAWVSNFKNYGYSRIEYYVYSRKYIVDGRRMKAVFSLSEKGVLNTARGRLQRSLWCWIKVEMSVKMPDFLTHAVMQVDKNRYRLDVCLWTKTCISYFCQLRRSRSNDQTVVVSTSHPAPRSWFINTPLKPTRLPKRKGWWQG